MSDNTLPNKNEVENLLSGLLGDGVVVGASEAGRYARSLRGRHLSKRFIEPPSSSRMRFTFC